MGCATGKIAKASIARGECSKNVIEARELRESCFEELECERRLLGLQVGSSQQLLPLPFMHILKIRKIQGGGVARFGEDSKDNKKS